MIFLCNLVFQSRYKLLDTGDHKEHTSIVFHFNARKVFSDALHYAWVQAVHQYLKDVIRQTDKKHGDSFVYLTEEQYRDVMYLIIFYPQLLILQIFIQTLEYMCVGPDVVDAKQFTGLLCSMQVLG
jgi:hypothetical protein